MSVGPVEVGGSAPGAFRVHALFSLRGALVPERLSLGRNSEARGGRHRITSSLPLCIGCKSCITACPWGACQWNPATNKAVKCDYCKDRVDQGLKPACVTKCLTQCLQFGEATRLPDHRRERFAKAVAADSFSMKDMPAGR
jgi:Na+-translocating ferredoxin:NAD+ oxidoreductase RNF subunit RnfB